MPKLWLLLVLAVLGRDKYGEPASFVDCCFHLQSSNLPWLTSCITSSKTVRLQRKNTKKMGNRSAQKFLRSFRSGESYWMSANWTRNPSQRIKRLFGLQTGTFQLKHHYSVHAVWILWAGTNGTNTSAFEAMNIVKILGLSFDKKSSKDLRYGKVPTMFSNDCKSVMAPIQICVVSVLLQGCIPFHLRVFTVVAVRNITSTVEVTPAAMWRWYLHGHVKVMIMADQDYNGSHIKGLLINFFHYFWPDLWLSSKLKIA